MSLSGMLLMCIEWWSFELLQVLAGWLPPNADLSLGAHAVVYSLICVSRGTHMRHIVRSDSSKPDVIIFSLVTQQMVYMLYLGMSIATSVLTGNYLGAQRPTCAKRTSILAISSTGIISVIIAVFTWIFSRDLGSIFSSDERVLDLVEQCNAPLFARFALSPHTLVLVLIFVFPELQCGGLCCIYGRGRSAPRHWPTT